MTEPTKPGLGDLDALRAAMTRIAATIGHEADASVQSSDPMDLGGVRMPDAVWAAHHGPRTPTIAQALFASPRARRVLTNAWAQECPDGEVLDAAVAPHDATPEQTALADATLALVNALHADACPRCHDRLRQLSRALDTLDEVDRVLSRWTFTTVTRALQSARGNHADLGTGQLQRPGGPDLTFSTDLDSPQAYVALTGKPRRERDRWPNVKVTITPTDNPKWEMTVRLSVPGGLAPSVEAATVVVHTGTGPVPIPFQLANRNDPVLRGTATVPAGTHVDPTTIDLEVTTHDLGR